MNADKSISITELEQELQTEEAFDELGHTLEFPVPTFVDPDHETTNIWQITTEGIHEIKPSRLTTWLDDGVEVFWVSFC